MKGNSKSLKWGKTMAIKVYIDQGHNPQSPNSGAEGNGFREQDITYRVGQELYALLNADPNFEPRLSRPTPETQLGQSNAESLRIRVNDANTWGADVFLSLHTNASDDSTASGTESLVFAENTPAYRLAEIISQSISDATGLRNRGVKLRPGLYVLRRTEMPAVLTELGFITNPGDATLMWENPKLFAQAIYNALLSYYG